MQKIINVYRTILQSEPLDDKYTGVTLACFHKTSMENYVWKGYYEKIGKMICTPCSQKAEAHYAKYEK